jgi:hypothetical protein
MKSVIMRREFTKSIKVQVVRRVNFFLEDRLRVDKRKDILARVNSPCAVSVNSYTSAR